MNGGRYNVRFAWPSAQWGSLPLAGGVEAAYKAEIEAASDPAARLREIEERLQRLSSPIRSAERFFIEDIVDPRETRALLCDFAERAAVLRQAGAPTFGMRP
jgi:acetyl-CoA carboxylase carboxyltransferase component